jgi:isocitrate/isopropylmalate dehydrogenase
MAMILAAAALLHHAAELGRADAEAPSRAIREAVLETAAAGIRTPDLGGHASTTGFTDEVISRIRAKLGSGSTG